jgi:hypothetical protein
MPMHYLCLCTYAYPQYQLTYAYPLMPIHLCLPTIPTHLCLPTMPIHLCLPTIPTHLCLPTIPIHLCLPTIPTHLCLPTIPTHLCLPMLMPTPHRRRSVPKARKNLVNNIKQDAFFMVSLEWPNLANLKSEYILAYYPNRLEILCKLTKHSLLSFTVGGATHQKGR